MEKSVKCDLNGRSSESTIIPDKDTLLLTLATTSASPKRFSDHAIRPESLAWDLDALNWVHMLRVLLQSVSTP